MANSKQAEKRARQTKARYTLRHSQRSQTRTAVKAAVSYTHLTLPTSPKV